MPVGRGLPKPALQQDQNFPQLLAVHTIGGYYAYAYLPEGLDDDTPLARAFRRYVDELERAGVFTSECWFE